VQIDGRGGLLLQRLNGVDMLTLLQRSPWRLLRFADTLAQAAVRIHQVRAPSDHRTSSRCWMNGSPPPT
jgi:hypothetical protein